MSIVVDIGNSRIKVAQFIDHQLLNVFLYNKDNIINELEKIPFKTGIISNVGNNKLEQKLLTSFPNLVLMSHELNLPIAIKYKSADSLGHDRIANAVGAYNTFPNRNNFGKVL